MGIFLPRNKCSHLPIDVHCLRVVYFTAQLTGHVAQCQHAVCYAGYYARTAALKALIQQFLTLCGEEQPKQILSLGAGYDTTWFHLKVSIRVFGFPAGAACLSVEMRIRLSMYQGIAPILVFDKWTGYQDFRNAPNTPAGWSTYILGYA